MRGLYDLLVRRPSGEEFGYILQTPSVALSTSMYNTNQSTIQHLTQAPNIPLNVGLTTPTQAGGQYDVRDSDGDKAITHLSWSGGAGQTSLDNEGASADQYLSSINMEVGVKGELSLAHKLDFFSVKNAVGPIFSALGYLLVATNGPGVAYSLDGETWGLATMTDTVTGMITDFATDGTYVYFCTALGANPGVFKSSAHDPTTFENLITTPITALAYASGMLYAATGTGAGHITSVPAYNNDTMAFLADNVTISLDTVSNHVYWTAYQGGTTFVYSLTYDALTDTMLVEELTHLRAGFVANCALGYLDNLYVGGYLIDDRTTVGQGIIYVINGPSVVPLVKIGPLPSESPGLSDEDLDNKVNAMSAYGDKLYIECSRDIYVWDIDDGGYHHLQEFFSPIIGTPSGQGENDAFQSNAFQDTAFQTSPFVYESLSWPGIVVHRNRMCSVYVAESEAHVDVDFSNSLASPSVFTIADTSIFTVGQYVSITDSTSTPSCDGDWYVHTIINGTTFTIESLLGVEFNASAAGVGHISFNDARGIAMRSDDYSDYGELITSASNFHTGSMAKDHYEVRVSHDELLGACGLQVAYNIDNEGWVEAPLTASDTHESRFSIVRRGYSVALKVTLLGDGTNTPKVRAVNEIWNFIPVHRHVYQLDCRSGAGEGRWVEDPEDAIAHLHQAADEHCTFEDRFTGEYVGIIEKIEYQQAGFSPKEGVSGLLQVSVREVS